MYADYDISHQYSDEFMMTNDECMFIHNEYMNVYNQYMMMHNEHDVQSTVSISSSSLPGSFRLVTNVHIA